MVSLDEVLDNARCSGDFLENETVLVNSRGVTGLTPLHFMATLGDSAGAQLLISARVGRNNRRALRRMLIPISCGLSCVSSGPNARIYAHLHLSLKHRAEPVDYLRRTFMFGRIGKDSRRISSRRSLDDLHRRLHGLLFF